MRPLKLPQDLKVLAEIIPPSFQYPENPEWSFAEDEIESTLNTLRSLKRFWPIISFIQKIYPGLRNILRGFIWEEDGKPVGLVNGQTRGNTDNWVIGNVAVLPEYRRRGIARKLVQAAIDMIAKEEGETIILDVINQNIPAYNLYKKLGFEHFSGEIELQTYSNTPTPSPALPPEQKADPYNASDWEPRYQLAKQIAPPENHKYEPIKKYHYKQPLSVRTLNPFIRFTMGVRVIGEFIRPQQEGQLIGWWRAALRTRSGGVNHIAARTAADNPQTAKYIIESMMHAAHSASPGRRTLLTLPQWQTDLVQAALNAGFEKRMELHRLGMIL